VVKPWASSTCTICGRQPSSDRQSELLRSPPRSFFYFHLLQDEGRALLLAVASLFILPTVIGCSVPQSPGAAAASTTTETIPGSAGHYYITVQGNTFYSNSNNGGGTYFSVQIPITIQ
jgi:hypothetical protein